MGDLSTLQGALNLNRLFERKLKLLLIVAGNAVPKIPRNLQLNDQVNKITLPPGVHLLKLHMFAVLPGHVYFRSCPTTPPTPMVAHNLKLQRTSHGFVVGANTHKGGG